MSLVTTSEKGEKRDALISTVEKGRKRLTYEELKAGSKKANKQKS